MLLNDASLRINAGIGHCGRSLRILRKRTAGGFPAEKPHRVRQDASRLIPNGTQWSTDHAVIPSAMEWSEGIDRFQQAGGLHNRTAKSAEEVAATRTRDADIDR